MKILLTGSGGFIGREASRYLAALGHVVLEVRRNVVSGITADLGQPGSLEPARAFGPESIVHLAAKLPPSLEGSSAEEAAAANWRIDENVFSFARLLGIGVVYASGASVYGPGDGEPRHESAELSPWGPYVTEKVRAEELGRELLHARGLPFSSLRISAPYGPGQRARTVLQIFLDRVSQGLPLRYHGTGGRTQDFTFVGDIVEALALAAIKKKSGVFNIASGAPISMKGLAELVIRCAPGSRSLVEASGQPDAQEGNRAVYDIKKARLELGWEPRTQLESGIRLCLSSKVAALT